MSGPEPIDWATAYRAGQRVQRAAKPNRAARRKRARDMRRLNTIATALDIAIGQHDDTVPMASHVRHHRDGSVLFWLER